MMKIYSNVNGKLLHIVWRLADFSDGRQDIIDNSQFLQCSALKMPEGRTFKPHMHIWHEGSERMIAQESWVVISGKVQVIFYDLDDKIISRVELEAGDACFTLFGGHNYLVMGDALVYEFKTGPYRGRVFDKIFIDELSL